MCPTEAEAVILCVCLFVFFAKGIQWKRLKKRVRNTVETKQSQTSNNYKCLQRVHSCVEVSLKA